MLTGSAAAHGPFTTNAQAGDRGATGAKLGEHFLMSQGMIVCLCCPDGFALDQESKAVHGTGLLGPGLASLTMQTTFQSLTRSNVFGSWLCV
jgi:predicted Zn-dependent protease